MKKYLVFIIFVGLFILGLLYFQKTTAGVKKISPQKTIENKLTVFQKISTVDPNPEVSTVFFKYGVPPGETALVLLQKTSTAKIKGVGISAFVTEINNREALEKNKEYWALYVNGKLSDVGAGSYILKDQDKIEWKVEKY